MAEKNGNFDTKIWQQRWKPKKYFIRKLGKKFGDSNAASLQIDRKKVFKGLLKELETFAHEQFLFFYDGFGFNGQNPPFLEKSSIFPPEYVLKRTLDQTEYDHSVIEKAILQRLDEDKVQAGQQADVLAYEALRPALGILPFQTTTVLTYFQKNSEVLVVPYAEVALIGISSSVIDVPENPIEGSDPGLDIRDYLAIPHEVGHYVYWRGVVNSQRLHVALRERLIQAGLSDYLHWLEEIFADVYSCIVAGPVVALSGQDLHLDNLPAEFTEDNGEHPARAIRPFIYLKTFELLDAYREETAALCERWTKKLSAFGNPSSFKLQPNNSTEKLIEMAQGKKDLEKIADVILKEVVDVKKGSWSKPFQGGDPLNLYTRFADKVYDDQTPLHRSNFDALQGKDTSNVGSPTTSWLYGLRQFKDTTKPQPVSLWTIVMNADGWGTGGPEEDGGSKD